MERPPRNPAPRRLLLGLVIALGCVAGVALWRGDGLAAPAVQSAAVGEVTLVWRTPEGEAPPMAVPIASGATVLDATRSAGRSGGDRWASTWRGDGPDAFLTTLGGEGSRPDEGLFWLFEVNGRESEVGAGVAALSPGDRVLWKLSAYE